MVEADEIKVKISADNEEFVRAVRDTVKHTERTADRISRLDKGFRGLKRVAGGAAKGLAAAAAATAAVTAATAALVNVQLKAIDTIAKTADRLNLTTEALVGLQFASEQYGVSNQTMQMGMQRMVRRMSEAAAGTGEAKKAIEELGLSASELTLLDADQQLFRVAEAMQKVDSRTRQLALAQKIFDSEGVVMVNVLRAGASGLEDMRKQAERLGLTLSRTDAAKIETLNGEITNITRQFEGFVRIFTVELAPVLTAVSRLFQDNASTATEMRDSIRGVVDAIVEVGIFGTRVFKTVEGFWIDGQRGFLMLGKALVDAANSGIQGWQEVTGLLRNFDQILQPISDTIAAVFNNPFAAIKLGFVALVEDMLQALINVSSKITDIAFNVSDTLGEAAAASEQFLRNQAAGVTQIRKDMEETDGGVREVAAAFDDLKESIKGVAKGEGSEELTLMSEAIAKSLAELQKQSADIDPDAFAEKIRSLIREGRKAAEEEAAAIAAQVEQDRANQGKAAGIMGGLVPSVSELSELFMAHRETIGTFLSDVQTMFFQSDGHFTSIWKDGLKEREKFTKMSTVAQTKQVVGAMQTMTQGVARHNKAMFEINKIAGIATATINTSEAVTKALAAYPPPLSFGMAALQAAAGLVEINAIRSQTFSKGGGGAPPPAPSPGNVAAPQTGSAGNSVTLGGQATLDITISDQTTSGAPEALVGALREAIEQVGGGDLQTAINRGR